MYNEDLGRLHDKLDHIQAEEAHLREDINAKHHVRPPIDRHTTTTDHPNKMKGDVITATKAPMVSSYMIACNEILTFTCKCTIVENSTQPRNDTFDINGSLPLMNFYRFFVDWEASNHRRSVWWTSCNRKKSRTCDQKQWEIWRSTSRSRVTDV